MGWQHHPHGDVGGQLGRGAGQVAELEAASTLLEEEEEDEGNEEEAEEEGLLAALS